MPLNKAQLISSLTTAFSNTHSASEAANLFADALDLYVKTATVTVNAGIPVATVGTAAAQRRKYYRSWRWDFILKQGDRSK